LRVAGRGSIREQEICEVLREDVGSRGGECVRTVHRHLVVNTDGDNVACRDGFQVDLIVGGHHTKRLLNAQVKGAAHALGDVPTKGAEAARHQTPGLRLALLDFLIGLEGGGLQLFQLLLRGVVGRLHSLSLGC
jgi:hypothetical protein